MPHFLHSLLRRPSERGSSQPAPITGVTGTKLGYLAETEVFHDLTREEMAELDRMTAMTTCRRGRVFYTPGETGEVLFILKQGRVNVHRVTSDGRKLITEALGPGS